MLFAALTVTGVWRSPSDAAETAGSAKMERPVSRPAFLLVGVE